MASIAQRHAYRFGYLKSEHWSNLRLEKLVEQNAKCWICGLRDISNDVHHVIYRRSLYETILDDLVVLCRQHHDVVHEVLESNSEIKDISTAQERWMETVKGLFHLPNQSHFSTVAGNKRNWARFCARARKLKIPKSIFTKPGKASSYPPKKTWVWKAPKVATKIFKVFPDFDPVPKTRRALDRWCCKARKALAAHKEATEKITAPLGHDAEGADFMNSDGQPSEINLSGHARAVKPSS